MSVNSASQSTADTDHSVMVGKFWAAVRGSAVVGLISMSVPADVDFEQYRERAVACLGLVGDVQSGVVVERSGSRYFRKRLSHANRSKKPRTPQEYLLTTRTLSVLHT